MATGLKDPRSDNLKPNTGADDRNPLSADSNSAMQFNQSNLGPILDGRVNGTIFSEIVKDLTEEAKKKKEEQEKDALEYALSKLLDEIGELQTKLADELDNGQRIANRLDGLTATFLATDEELQNTNAKIMRVDETLRQNRLLNKEYSKHYEEAVLAAALADENVAKTNDELTYQEHRVMHEKLLVLPLLGNKPAGYEGTNYHVVMRDAGGFYFQTAQGHRIDVKDAAQLEIIAAHIENGGKTGDQVPDIAAAYEAAGLNFAAALHESEIATLNKFQAAGRLEKNASNIKAAENELARLKDEASVLEAKKTDLQEQIEKAKAELNQSLENAKAIQQEIDNKAAKAGVSAKELIAEGGLSGDLAARYSEVTAKNEALQNRFTAIDALLINNTNKITENALLTEKFTTYRKDFLPMQRALLEDPEFSRLITRANTPGITNEQRQELTREMRDTLRQKSPDFEKTFKDTFNTDLYTELPNGTLAANIAVFKYSLTDPKDLNALKDLFLKKQQAEASLATTTAHLEKVEKVEAKLEQADKSQTHKDLVLENRNIQPIDMGKGLTGFFNAVTSQAFASRAIAHMDVLKDAAGNPVFLDENKTMYHLLLNEETGKYFRQEYSEDEQTAIMANHKNAKGEMRMFASESPLHKDPTRGQDKVFKLTAGDVLLVCNGVSCRLLDQEKIDIKNLKAVNTQIEKTLKKGIDHGTADTADEQNENGKDTNKNYESPAPKPDAGLMAIAEHKNAILAALAGSKVFNNDDFKDLATKYGIPESHLNILKASVAAIRPDLKFTDAAVLNNYSTLGTKDPENGLSSKLAFASAAEGKSLEFKDDIAFKFPSAAPVLMNPAA